MLSHFSVKVHRKLHYIIKKKFNPPPVKVPFDFTGEEAAEKIRNIVEGTRPAMIARFGVTEMDVILVHYYKHYRSVFERYLDYYKLKTDYLVYDNLVTANIQNLSGFFPLDEASLDHFADLYLNCAKELDLLATFPWVYPKEQILKQQFFPDCPRIDAETEFEPFNPDHPWTRGLASRKVLIVHPFAESIQRQHHNMRYILPPDIMPSFELKVVKAVQSLLGNPTAFRTWFEAYDDMRDKIGKVDFDVAILGCGAYGFPLAAWIKKMGKKALHLGGATQVLFGIKGARYDDMPSINRFYNAYWIRPGPSEQVRGQEIVENACYW